MPHDVNFPTLACDQIILKTLPTAQNLVQTLHCSEKYIIGNTMKEVSFKHDSKPQRSRLKWAK